MAAATDWHEAFVAGQFTSNYDETIDSFDAMNLKSDLLRGVHVHGFEKPSAVQRRAIMPVIKGNDMIVQAQLDGNELATLCIPVLQKVDADHPTCQALVLASTRELVRRIQEVTITIAKFTQTRSCACVGGAAKFPDNVEALQDGSQVVVGTPGSIHNMIRRRVLNVDSITTIVLDKVDEILSLGYGEQVSEILQLLPQSKQVVFFSATLPQDVLELSTKFMQEPVCILIKGEGAFKGIAQFYVIVDEEDRKLDIFSNLYEIVIRTQAVIFCRSRRKVEWLTNELTARDLVVSTMHADLTALRRRDLMDEFRSGSSRVLIATDMSARGLDMQQVSLVVNYDLPDTCEKYVHRIGSGGLLGRKGVTINLVTPDEVRMIREIEQFYNTQIVEAPVNMADLTDLIT